MRKSLLLLYASIFLIVVGFGTHALIKFSERQKMRKLMKLPLVEHAVKEHKPIVVVIPSYNNPPYCERNLRSVLDQKYDNFRVIYIDDCSADNTYASVQQLVESSGQ